MIYTDHRPITKAIASKSDKSPRQFRHLEFISQFCTDIRYLEGTKNIVADTLSRSEIEAVSIDKFDIESIIKAQEEDEELKQMLS